MSNKLISATAWYRVIDENEKNVFRKVKFNHLEMGEHERQVSPTVKVPGSIQEQWKKYKWVAVSGYIEDGVFKPLQIYEGGEYVKW
jgi:hypothetical protein